LPEKNTAIAEDLASHGYIVCSVYHRDFDKTWPGPVHRRQSELRAALDHLDEMNQNKDLEIAANIDPGVGIDKTKSGKEIHFRSIYSTRFQGIILWTFRS
jgi:hypothetical protein